jgi:integrating conjugative element protein (TIGR03749 family)
MTRMVGFCLLLFALADARADQILNWKRIPLSVELRVGVERVVFLERSDTVRVGVPVNIESALRVQTAKGAIYLRASAAFEAARLQLEDAASGELILVDIRATESTPGEEALEPVRIVGPEEAPRSDLTIAPDTPIPVVLTRYAAQSLYAPLRTVEAVPGVLSMPVSPAMSLDSLLPELAVEAQVLAAWRLADFWVTAVKLVHLEAGRVALDPRALQGDFVAATFQHADLGPAGGPSDTTVVYLITRDGGLPHKLLPVIRRLEARKPHEK